MKKHLKPLLLTIACLILAGAVYLGLKKFRQDRDKARSFEPRALRPLSPAPQPQQTTHTYTREELEEARRKGVAVPGAKAPALPPPGSPAQAAAEQSQRTVQEINRINEMNRRLMEQQQRLNQK